MPTTYPTLLPSHQRSIRWRQNPESARSTISTPGQRSRSALTSIASTAQACLAPSMPLGRRCDTSRCLPQNTYSGR